MGLEDADDLAVAVGQTTKDTRSGLLHDLSC
jgi:hypothetical protein